MGSIGYTFEPNAAQAESGARGGQPQTTPESAMQTLAYQLPSQTSQRSISPFVGQTRAGSSFGSAVLQSVLRTVLGADAADALMSGSGGEDASRSSTGGTGDAPFARPQDTGASVVGALQQQQTARTPSPSILAGTDNHVFDPSKVHGPSDPSPSFSQPNMPDFVDRSNPDPRQPTDSPVLNDPSVPHFGEYVGYYNPNNDRFG